jgi:GT2 family glycosyltransferase
MKILAAIVTYNRLNLLEDVLTSLKSQTCKLDQILVVNNGSTDDTAQWLNHQNDIKIINQENVGGAGGFYTAMDWGVQNGFDWVWIMDDDVEADNRCLEYMTSYLSTHQLIMPLKMRKDTLQLAEDTCVSYNLSNPFKRRNNSVTLLYKNKPLPPIIETDDSSFEGLLIKTSVIKKIGLPKRDFFIIGDDTEYGLRFKKFFAESPIIVTKAILYRKLPVAAFSDWKYYYLVRNTSYLYKTYAKSALMRRYNAIYCLKEFGKNVMCFKFKRASYVFWALLDSNKPTMLNRFLP